MLAHQPKSLRRLRTSTSIDVSFSEYLITRWQYLPMPQEEVADLVMIDPTWGGGITEGQKNASLADVFGLPVTMHDCTGPFTTLARMYLAANALHALYQGVGRSYLHYVYPQWVDEAPVVREGNVAVPRRPGLGAELDPKLGQRENYHSRVCEA
jgi:L-alanine-DL-glutamate epimerase-like enolase superfamily enzyme